MAASTYYTAVQQLYVAYFGRPADKAGLEYYATLLDSRGGDTQAMMHDFAASTESAGLYNQSTTSAKINAMYQTLFGHDADLSGLLYWTNLVQNGTILMSEAARHIAYNAAPEDKAIHDSKVTAAVAFTDGITTTTEALAYETQASVGRTWLTSVVDTASATSAQATITTTLATAVTTYTNTTTAGSTFTLTTAADTGTPFTGTANNDSFVATLASPGETNDSSTLTAGDALTGGAGTDTLTVTVGGAAITATTAAPILSGIEKVLVSNQEADAADNVTFDLTSATGMTHLGTTSSVANGDTTFTNVGAAVAVQMAGAGDLTVKFSDTVVSGTSDSVTVTLNGATGAAALTLDNQTGGQGAFETVNLASSTSTNSIALTDVDTKSVTVTGDKALTLSIAGSTAVTAVDASALTAALTLSGDAAAAVNITGGSANDSITLGNFASTDTVNGGSGTDTLNVSAAITASTDLKNVSNVEVLAVTGAINVTLAADVAGLATIDTTTGASASTVTFGSGYTAATTVKADATDVISNSGANAAITVTFSSDDAVTVTGGTGTDTLQVTASSSAVTFAGAITAVDNVTIVDNGDATSGATGLAGEDVTLTLGAYATALTIDASALEAGTLDAAGAMNADWENLTVSGASATKALNVTGGAGADSITGGTANDVINGGAGNDSIVGSAGGSDSINGGEGDDTIDMVAALTSADTIDGGAGNDTLSVTSLSASGLTNVTNVETLSLSGAASTATLTANLSFTSIDMASVDNAAQVLTLSTGYTNATTVAIDAGDKVANSANVAMTVSAVAADLQAADATTITGGTGTDTLSVKADNTTANIVATSGLITLVDVINVTDGGDVTTGTVTAGKDITIDLASYATALTIDASALDSGAVVSGAMTNDEVLTITGVSAAALNVTGGGGADTIVGSNAAAGDNLTGGAGNDTFTMGTNLSYLDTVTGGDGTDTITTGAAAVSDINFMHVTGVEKITLGQNGAGAATLSSYFDASGITTVTLHTTAGAVDASGTTNGHTFVSAAAVNETVTGGLGNDTFTFNNTATLDANDVINGTSGTDTILLNNAAASLSATLDLDSQTKIDVVTLGTASGLAATSAETVSLTVAALTLTTAQTVSLDGSVITDSNDTISITNSAATTTTKFSITGGAGADTLAGSNAVDTISGGTGADVITGNAGADSLTGGAGNDTFAYTVDSAFAAVPSGSASSDVISDFVTGEDVISITLNAAAATGVHIANVGSAASNADALSLLSSKAGEYYFNTTTKQLVMDVNGDGLLQANDLYITLSGVSSLAAADVVVAATLPAVNVNLAGGSGNDTFTMAAASFDSSDTIAGGAGTDTIVINDASGAATADADFTNLTSIEKVQLTGASTAVVDTLANAAGLTTIVTGTGATTVTASTLTSVTVDASAITDALTLNGAGTTNHVVTLGAGGTGTLAAAAAGTLAVTSADLTGNALTITAGAGNITVTGGGATDTITVTGMATASQTFTGSVAKFDITGGANGQSITTGVANDTIDGAAGDDTIVSGSGDDVVTGGAGIDTITLGDGADVVVFNTIVAAANANNITAFVAGAGGDIIRFDAVTFTSMNAGVADVVATVATAEALADDGSAWGAGASNYIIVDTEAAILAGDLSGEAGGAVLAVSSDTGKIYYDADGNLSAGAVVIGTITTLTGTLVAGNFDIV